jgi:hypothetical protein
MQRVALKVLCIVLLISSTSYGQSLGDAARANRKQKGAAPTKVVTSDDLVATPEIIQLIPGSNSTGQGTLVAPARGKHSYRVIMLDTSRFVNGGTIHITITVGDGESEASFDLYPQGLPLPSEGFPNSLANAWNIAALPEQRSIIVLPMEQCSNSAPRVAGIQRPEPGIPTAL